MLAKLVYDRCVWPESTRLLDFGCGHHGNLSTALCQYTDLTVAVDADAHAVAQFNKWCKEQGLEPAEVCAFTTAELLAQHELRHSFDIVAASLVFHHIELDARRSTASMLRDHLRSGGMLVILDVLKQQGLDINGFTVVELTELLLGAGFSDVRVELGPRITLHSQKRTRIVIATAVNR